MGAKTIKYKVLFNNLCVPQRLLCESLRNKKTAIKSMIYFLKFASVIKTIIVIKLELCYKLHLLEKIKRK